MAFAKETIRNEIMLRFGEVVGNRGKLIGALQRSLEQVLEDGKIISSKPLEPEQLSALPGQSGTPLADVLGEINSQTILDNQLLAATLAAEQAKTANLSEQLTVALDEVRRLMAVIDTQGASTVDGLAEVASSER